MRSTTLDYQAVLDFWFGAPTADGYGKPQKFWFVKSLNTDAEIASLFTATYQAAANNLLAEWQRTAASCLALTIVLDQFPRNIYRGTPKAFATDNKALAIAKYALTQQYDRHLLPVQRWFLYLPFEHSEDITEQKTSIELFETLKNDPHSANTIDYAHKHLKIIQRFGRFPHRNEILGRESTLEEIAFLKQPGSRF